MIHMTDGYHGKPAGLVGTIRNDLLKCGDTYVPTPAEFVSGERIMDLSKKKVVHNIVVLMENPPLIPLISTSLLRVDNAQGRVNWIYILPPDKPVIWGAEMGEASEFVFKSAVAAKAPIIN